MSIVPTIRRGGVMEHKFEVGQIYNYTDNKVIYNIRIDRVNGDRVYYSTLLPTTSSGGWFATYSDMASFLTLESDAYVNEKDERIKELEGTVLDLQSELARKKMSLTVACNRVEELEDKLKIAVDCLQRQIDEYWSVDVSDTLEQLGELK